MKRDLLEKKPRVLVAEISLCHTTHTPISAKIEVLSLVSAYSERVSLGS